MVLAFLGLALFVASLTVLFLSMRAVMDIGGYCASGGPYEISATCPGGTGWAVPLSILLGIVAVFVYLLGSIRLPGPRLVLLAWPALFLSLGWNFWAYGLNPPGVEDGLAWSWIICGVLFWAMGGLPLLALLSPAAFRATFWADAPSDSSATVRGSFVAGMPPVRLTRAGRAAVHPGTSPSPAAADPTTPPPPVTEDDVAGALERVARLYAEGALSDDEFRRAKARILGGDDGS